MMIKLITCSLLDLVYSLLTYFIFVHKLIVDNKNDRFWQHDAASSHESWHSTPRFMTMAPISTTGMEVQCVFTNVMLLSHEFWALMMAGNEWLIALRLLTCQIMAITWVNIGFRLGTIWFGKPPREPPDPCRHSRFQLLYDAVCVALVEPVIDD